MLRRPTLRRSIDHDQQDLSRAPPEDQLYGVEAIGKDNSGNWFSMTERKPIPDEANRAAGDRAN